MSTGKCDVRGSPRIFKAAHMLFTNPSMEVNDAMKLAGYSKRDLTSRRIRKSISKKKCRLQQQSEVNGKKKGSKPVSIVSLSTKRSSLSDITNSSESKQNGSSSGGTTTSTVSTSRKTSSKKTSPVSGRTKIQPRKNAFSKVLLAKNSRRTPNQVKAADIQRNEAISMLQSAYKWAVSEAKNFSNKVELAKIASEKFKVTVVPQTLRKLIREGRDQIMPSGPKPAIDDEEFKTISAAFCSYVALDSAHLLGLVMAKQALEDAGYNQGKEFNRETTGVILGGSGLWKSITPLTSRLQYPLWKKICQKSGLSQEQTDKIIENMKAAYVPWQENSFPGMLPNVVAGRITNRFDLGGTNCVVDAACASSLSALKMAISELIEGRCDMMLTGGFDTDNSILNYMCFSKTPAFSKKDCLNPFDATSDGMMVGEGLGMLVIKRLEDAERDGDRIYAVIKGIGTASDGRFKSIYAPRPEGQVRALRRAYQEAGFSPATLGLCFGGC